MALPRFIDIHPSGQTSFNPLPKGFPLWGNGKGAVLQKKSGLPCSDKPLFRSILNNGSYLLPRYCEKFLCHHQIFFIVIIFFSLKLKSLLSKREAG